MHSSDSRAIFASAKNSKFTIGDGETMVNPDLADTLETLAREGEDFFYRGEFASTVAELCQIGGGLLNRADFESYRVQIRSPLVVDYCNAKLFTNPVPSTGGLLIAFALNILNDISIEDLSFGTLDYLNLLITTMDLTNQARIESGLSNYNSSKDASEILLKPEFLSSYKEEIFNRPRSYKGTTHILSLIHI